MQHEFCCVDIISRSWRTWKITKQHPHTLITWLHCVSWAIRPGPCKFKCSSSETVQNTVLVWVSRHTIVMQHHNTSPPGHYLTRPHLHGDVARRPGPPRECHCLKQDPSPCVACHLTIWLCHMGSTIVWTNQIPRRWPQHICFFAGGWRWCHLSVPRAIFVHFFPRRFFAQI